MVSEGIEPSAFALLGLILARPNLVSDYNLDRNLS